MENKHGSGAKAGSMGGKGFYIVLLLCAAAIGVSAWMLLTDAGTNVEDEAQQQIVDVSGAYVTMLPADYPVRSEQDVDVMAEAAPTEASDPEATPAAETDEVQPEEVDETTQTGEAPPMEVTHGQTEPESQETLSDGTVSYIWPVKGDIQRPYAVDKLLYDSTMADWRTHDGVDVACEQGAQVMSTANGLVVDVHNDDLLGTVVEIDHENGIHSVYANLAAEPTVVPGQTVTMGQVIGAVGNTALGEVNQVSHLHFAVKKDGISTDPLAYLPSDWTE